MMIRSLPFRGGLDRDAPVGDARREDFFSWPLIAVQVIDETGVSPWAARLHSPA
jgi:hypothetical protein